MPRFRFSLQIFHKSQSTQSIIGVGKLQPVGWSPQLYIQIYTQEVSQDKPREAQIKDIDEPWYGLCPTGAKTLDRQTKVLEDVLHTATIITIHHCHSVSFTVAISDIISRNTWGDWVDCIVGVFLFCIVLYN